MWLGSRWACFVLHWIKLSIPPRSPRGETAAGTAGSARRDGRTRGPTAAKDFWIGKYAVREKGEVEGGQRGKKEAEKGSRTKQAGGYSQHPKPLNRALSPGGSPAGSRGPGLLPQEVASWKVAWGAQGGSRRYSPLQLGKHGASSPESKQRWLCLFRPQRPAVRGLWMTRDFLMMALSTIMISLCCFPFSKLGFFQGKRLEPFSIEMRSPRPSFTCVPLPTPDGGAYYHGLFRPTKTVSSNTPQHLSHAHSCLFLFILFSV